MSEEVEKVQADSVVDIKTDGSVVQEWYDEASAVRTVEGLQKLLERLTGEVRMTGDTTPHAHGAIALAALRMSTESKLGKMNREQQQAFIGILKEAFGI